MEIRPPKFPASLPASTTVQNPKSKGTPSNSQGPSPDGKTARLDIPEKAAHRSEKEANERILKAQESVREAQKEAAAVTEDIRAANDEQLQEIQDRNQERIVQERAEGYENLLRLRRAQEAEIHRVKTQGEKTKKQLDDYYDGEIYRKTRDSEMELKRVLSHENDALEHATKEELFKREQLQKTSVQDLEQLKDHHEIKLHKLKEGSEKEYEQMKTNYEQGRQESQTQFHSQFDKITSEQDQILTNLYQNASHKLNTIRRESAEHLAGYDNRKEDPFYRMVLLDPEIKETDDAIILKVRIPSHEQDQVTVNIQGDAMIVSGQRRNHELLETKEGRQSTTHSFQSFSERIPLPTLVEARGLTKRFDGDTMTVHVPKLESRKKYKAFQKPEAEHSSIQKPRFPENLPHTKEVSRLSPSEGEINDRLKPSRSKPGSQTLD